MSTSHAELTQHSSESRYRELMENMSEGVAVYRAVDEGENFIFLDHNQAGERITGQKYEHVVGKYVTDVFPGVEEIGLLDVFRRVWKTGLAEEHPISQYQDERIFLWVDNYVFKLPGGEIVSIYRDITKQQLQQERIAYLSLLRKTGIAIHRILATPQDSQQLLQAICEVFVTEKGYRSAWIVLLDENRNCRLSGNAGLLKGFDLLEQKMRGGDLPSCISKVIKERQIVWQTSQHALCTGCQMANGYPDNGIMSVSLQHGDRFYGVLTVSLVADMVADREARELFEEISRDIAFALYNQELDTERKQKEYEISIRDQISRIFALHRGHKLYDGLIDIVLKAMQSRQGLFAYVEEPDMLVCPSMTPPEREQGKMTDETIVFEPDTWAPIWKETLKTCEIHYSNTPFRQEGHLTIDNFISVAVVSDDKAIGLLQVANKETGYDEQDRKLLGSIAATIAPILQAKLDQQQAEQELQATLEEYADLYNNVPDMLISVNAADGKIIQCNQTLLDTLGYNRNEIIGHSAFDLYHPDCKDKVGDKIFSTWQNTGTITNQEMMLQRKDGSCLPVTIDVSSVRDEDNNIIQSSTVIHEISDRKKLEEQLLISEKMATIAGLAAGVAHEINTPLSGIMQSIQLINMGFDPAVEQNRILAAECGFDLFSFQNYLQKKELDFFLNGIQDSAAMAARIINSLLQFSRPQKSDPVPENLAELFDRSIELARTDYDLKKKYNILNIEFIREYSSNLPEVSCVGMEIEQVLINLIKNSCQAMAGNPSNTKSQIIVRTERSDEFAVIEVEDNGPGIRENIKHQIFDPFFTTKDIGEGTGLGLAVSYSIICDKHNGSMLIESAPGKGTRCIIKLPIMESGSNGNE